MLVIDASVAFEMMLRTPLAARFEERVVRDDLHVPHLMDVEIVSALRRVVLAGGLDLRDADEALRALLDWPLTRHEHTSLLPRIWSLRNAVSSYDATYVALAEALDVPLLTCDARLSRSHGHHATIELLN